LKSTAINWVLAIQSWFEFKESAHETVATPADFREGLCSDLRLRPFGFWVRPS
jgi:hypothetical protein